jgi:serine/threonine protein kinase
MLEPKLIDAMSTAGPSPQSAVEAFVQGRIDLVTLEDELDECCAKDEGAAWDALALLDQFYRRGRIAEADFRTLKKRVNRHAQKPLGAASYATGAKSDTARIRSTLAVPVGDVEAPPAASKREPSKTQLIHPDVLDLEFDPRLEPQLAGPALGADLAPDFEIELDLDDDSSAKPDQSLAADLPEMYTRELPRPSEPPAERIAKDPAATMLIGRVEPTVMVGRAHTEFLNDDFGRNDFAPSIEPPELVPTKERDSTRPVEPTMHEGHRVLRDRFELGPLLGRGGMASVYQARDRHREGVSEREQWVAVKVLNDGVIRAEEGARALQREFQHVQMLTHPAIVKVLDFDYDGTTPFLVMELIEGENLESMLARGERLSRRVALTLIHHLALALGYAHDNDIVHADFKPGNVMVAPSGQVKILDLGVSWRWQREPRLAAEEGRGSLLATPAYASQEVLNGSLPEVRDDIFSLGCLAYELLVGEHPFRRIPITKAIGQGLRPKRISWLTRPQWRTLASSLAWDREERPASVQAFLDGLGLRGTPAALPPPSKWGEAEASRVPTVVRFAIAAAACTLVAVAVLPRWWSGDSDVTSSLPTAPTATVPDSAPPAAAANTAPRAEPPVSAAAKPAPERKPPVETAPRAVLTAAPPETQPVTSAPPPAAPAPQPGPAAPVVRTEPPRDVAAAAAATAALAPGRAGRIAFAGETFNVSERDALARIELVRSRGSQGRVGVHWETEDITAMRDTDYADMGDQVAWFDNGQTRVTLLVPLVVGGDVKDLRAFRVRIKDPEGGAELGGETEAMVVISDE